jgi:hypothetical protein
MQLADTPDPLPVWKKKYARCKLTGGRFVLPKPDLLAWPANAFDCLPDFDPEECKEGTEANVPDTWKSPFVGKSLGYVSSWVAWIPKPPKKINKTYFVVLQKELYEREGKVLICRVRERKRKVQTIPVEPEEVGGFQIMFRRERWMYCYREQSLNA